MERGKLNTVALFDFIKFAVCASECVIWREVHQCLRGCACVCIFFSCVGCMRVWVCFVCIVLCVRVCVGGGGLLVCVYPCESVRVYC